ncbi:MAG: sel1 repeat family protein [Rubrivivax sp.]|nr:sel1 repeat family protein [Rubrivivax sp.]
MKATTLTDGLSDLRLRMGFPTNAPLWLNVFLLLPSLSAMLTMRHHLGVRMVSTPRLVMLAIAMLLWGLLPSLVLQDELHTVDDLFRPMFQFTGVVLALGIFYRVRRWTMRLKGERLNTLSMGVSWLSGFLPQNTAERYVDPLLCIGAGVLLCTGPFDSAYAIQGAWFVLSGVTLYGIEKYLHEIQLNHEDELLNAEAHQFRFGTLTASAAASAPSAPPVATGIDPALAASIARRKQVVARAEERAEPAVPASQVGSSAPVRIGDTQPPPAPGTGADPDLVAAYQELVRAPGPEVPQEGVEAVPEPVVREPVQRKPHAKMPLDRGTIAALAVFVAVLLLVGLVHQHERSQRSQHASVAGNLPQANAAAPQLDPYKEDIGRLAMRASDMYLGANGDREAEARAVRLFRVAAERGHPVAQYIMGDVCLRGAHGQPRDEPQGVLWLQRSAAQKNPDALYALGELYEAGKAGLPASDVKAFEFYRAAADLDHAEAQVDVGLRYLAGTGGVAENRPLAVLWFVKAYRNGSERGRNAVQILVDAARAGDRGSAKLLQDAGVDWRGGQL